MTRRLSAKIMEEKLKLGWTTSQLASHFGFQNNEDFTAHLVKFFGDQKASDYLSRLLKNDKRNKKKLHSSVVEVSKTGTDDLNGTGLIENPDTTLENMKLYANSLKNELTELELTLQRSNEDKQKLSSMQADILRQLSELREKIVIFKEKYLNSLSEKENIESSIKTLEIQIQEKNLALSEVESKIAELSKLVVYVYGDGQIEYSHPYEFQDDSHSLYEAIVSDDGISEVENLTLKQVKQLAKLIMITKFLIEENRKYEIIFDDEKMEVCYQHYISRFIH